MNDSDWNSINIENDEKPQISLDELREMAADLDPDDYDEPVQMFLNELMQAEDTADLKKAATLLLQDEVDFSPELAALGVEPDAELITLLIATGADVNAHNPYGLTPLHVVAKYGYTRLAEMLLTAGAKVTVLSHDKKFPLDLATGDELKKLLALPDMFEAEPAPLSPELEAMMREAEGDCHCGDDCHCGEHHH